MLLNKKTAPSSLKKRYMVTKVKQKNTNKKKMKKQNIRSSSKKSNNFNDLESNL